MKNYTEPQRFVDHFESVEHSLTEGLRNPEFCDPQIDPNEIMMLLDPYQTHLSLNTDCFNYGDFSIGKGLPKAIFSVELSENYTMSNWGNIPEGYDDAHGAFVTYSKDQKWRVSSNVYSLDDEFNAAFPQLVVGYDRLDDLLMMLELTQ